MKLISSQLLVLCSLLFIGSINAQENLVSSANKGSNIKVSSTLPTRVGKKVTEVEPELTAEETLVVEEEKHTITEAPKAPVVEKAEIIKEEVIKKEAIKKETIKKEAAVIEKTPSPVVEEKVLKVEEKIAVKKETAVIKEKVEKKKVAIHTVAPSAKKFNLINWTLSVPTDKDGNGKADQIKEVELSRGYSNEYFYASKDGGMVFKSPIGGTKTSSNTSFTRSELREMLRAGDKKIKTKGPNANNWVLKSSNSVFDAGGYDGQLKAKLAVNHVTTTGAKNQVGRVIVGQIHAEHNEPLRIYYRKLPGNTNGSIYFAHEPRDKQKRKELYYELIGSKSSEAKDPKDGIPLGEKFSYQVLVLGNILTVRIVKADNSVYEKSIDMFKSGYAAKEEYMYFKAGVYNQNKTGEPDDYVQATFYELSNRHKKYVEPVYDD